MLFLIPREKETQIIFNLRLSLVLTKPKNSKLLRVWSEIVEHINEKTQSLPLGDRRKVFDETGTEPNKMAQKKKPTLSTGLRTVNDDILVYLTKR